jgi:penicillin-binding protein-related factor A (putative recombinase)
MPKRKTVGESTHARTGHDGIKEKDIEKLILDYLQLIPQSRFWKNNTMGIYDPTTRKMRTLNGKHHARGAADILGVIQGRFVAIEVKRPKGKVSDEQELFLQSIVDAGGIAFVAYSLGDVTINLQKFGVI